MSPKQRRDCCHKGNYYEPLEAPDGTLAHGPHCDKILSGEYMACTAGCGRTFQWSPSCDPFGEISARYCKQCDPLRSVEVRVPAFILELGKSLWNKFRAREGKKT